MKNDNGVSHGFEEEQTPNLQILSKLILKKRTYQKIERK